LSIPRRVSAPAPPANLPGWPALELIAGAAAAALGLGVLMGCRGPVTTFTPEKRGGTSAVTLENQSCDPLGSLTNRALVLVFLSVECPICNRYVPELLRLASLFTPQGIEFRLVYPNADESPEEIRRYLGEFQLAALAERVLLDPKHVLVAKSGARVTPEVAVFLPGNRLVYRGRIDDRFPALGLDRREPTRRDLEMVLNAMLHFQPLLTAGEPAVGCSIPSLH